MRTSRLYYKVSYPTDRTMEYIIKRNLEKSHLERTSYIVSSKQVKEFIDHMVNNEYKIINSRGNQEILKTYRTFKITIDVEFHINKAGVINNQTFLIIPLSNDNVGLEIDFNREALAKDGK